MSDVKETRRSCEVMAGAFSICQGRPATLRSTTFLSTTTSDVVGTSNDNLYDDHDHDDGDDGK